MTKGLEQTEDKKGFIRRAYEGFKGLNKTLKIGIIGYCVGLGIATWAITEALTREIPSELSYYNKLESELSYLSNKKINVQDLLNDRYIDSVRTTIKSIKAKKDSLESLSSFNEIKEHDKKSTDSLFYLGLGGASVMCSFIPPIFIGSKRERNKKRVN